MRVLMLTQALDENDWLVGFIPRWVDELARHVDQLDVVALRVGAYSPPPNVRAYSMGKEQGRGRPGLVAGFYRGVVPLLRRVDAVFVHMIPRFALMAVPFARLYGKPMTLWYTHRQISAELRLATALCQHIVTAAPESFPLPTPKLHVFGHGIDTAFFAPAAAEAHDFPSLHCIERGPGGEVNFILHVARLSPIKHQATLLHALAQGVDARAVFVGDTAAGGDVAYGEHLKMLAKDLGIADRVTFTGGLPARAVRDGYRRAAVAVNLSPPGLFDKAALESMAMGVPTIVSNSAFDPLLGDHASQLRITSPQDAEELAERLRALLALSPEARTTIGRDLRENVKTAHSLERLMINLVGILKSSPP